MPYFNIVAETSENTVVTEYEPVKKRSDSYQSEAALEQEFIRLLCEQGYLAGEMRRCDYPARRKDSGELSTL